MAAIVILKDYLDDIKHFYKPQALLNFLNSNSIAGEDYRMVQYRSGAQQQQVNQDEVIARFENFKLDSQGNITASIIKYGPLRNYDDSDIFFVIRSFIDYRDILKVIAIDVKYG